MRNISQKWRAIFGLSAGLLLVLTQFQNCAPANPAVDAGQDGGVRVVEDWDAEKVNILAAVVQSEPESDMLTIEGLCARKMGAAEPMTWQIRSAMDTLLAGEVICELGGFRLVISGLTRLNCNEPYSLEIRAGDDSTDRAVLIRGCAP